MKRLIKMALSLMIVFAGMPYLPVSAAAPQVKPSDFGIDLEELIANDTLEYKTFKDEETGVQMNYWFHAPKDYETEEYPILTFFHGYGEGGDGIADASGNDINGENMNNIALNAGIIYALLTPENLKENPCIIIAPQTPRLRDGSEKSKWVHLGEGSVWNVINRDMDKNDRTPNLKTALHIIEDVEDTYHADQDRIYLSGLSMGGMAVWDLATRDTEKFAAAAPICGVADTTKGEQLKDLPIKTYHGALDNTVPADASRNIYRMLAQYGNISYTEYPDEAHSSWNEVYSNDHVQDLIDWMFNQSKEGPLDGKVDTAPLQQILETAKASDPEEYDETTWEQLQEICTEAEAEMTKETFDAQRNRYYCGAITKLLDQVSEKENIALEAAVSADKEPIDRSKLAGLHDGIMQDVRENFTIFSNNDLPVIKLEWDEPQTITGIDLYTFVAKKYGPQKYELFYTVDGERRSYGTREIEWQTDSNQIYENDEWIFVQPLEAVSSIELVMIQGGNRGKCTIQELLVYNQEMKEQPYVTQCEEFSDLRLNSLSDLENVLPKYARAELSDGGHVSASLEWDLRNIDRLDDDSFTLYASLCLPNQYANVRQVRASIRIICDQANDPAMQALRNMLNKAIALDSDDAALNTAIITAQAVLDKEAPTVTEVVTALLDLSEAMQDLDGSGDADALRADVQATIDFINENILTNVEGLRPGKVDALKDAVAAAQDVVDDPDASADELKAANKAMSKAAQELWEIVTKAELDALIEAANGYLDGDYTAESLEALQTTIESAQAAAGNDDATTAEVTEAITNLSNAIAGLESITLDTSALEHEIELVTEMVAHIDDYVPSTVEGLADKLADAQNVLANAASQEETDAATEILREARLNARTKADVSALEELIAYVNSLDLSAYTAESAYSVLVLADHTLVKMNDPKITQDEVDALAEELQSAVNGLQQIGDANITTPDNGTTDSTTADTTNTAAATQTAEFAGMLAVSAAAILMMNRRRQDSN